MGYLGTSNKQLAAQITANQSAQFKATNNLLTLQENHVEEFFQYHGEMFFTSLEQLIEDVVERVVSQLLVSTEWGTTGTSGNLTLTPESQLHMNNVTAENIQLDIQNLVAACVNSEVVIQRKLAKQQYLESQGFSTGTPALPNSTPNMQPYQPMPNTGATPVNGGIDPSMIQGGSGATQFNQTMYQQQQAFNNNSGYPIPPAGTDTMGNPYWIDPNTGQMTYTPPSSGLGLGQMISKGAAWAAWLA